MEKCGRCKYTAFAGDTDTNFHDQETGDASERQSDLSESGQSLGSPITAQTLSQIDEKALVRKIDRRVLPVLFAIYVAAFLDRYVSTNL